MGNKVVLNFRNKDQVLTKIEIDDEERPQLAEYFQNFEKGEEFSSYDLACAFQNLDRDKALPREIFNSIVSVYKSEIEAGNAEAMLNLGSLYYNGHGCEQDFTKAVYYYEMAAKHDNRQAHENLGYCYYYGRNVRIDYEKAFYHFAIGAFEGKPVSLYKIGDMFRNGYYVGTNPDEAFVLYMCAYKRSDENSRGQVALRLGNAYLNGEGVEADPRTALKYFQEAELYLYDMIRNGDYMYFKSLKAAVDSQEIARIRLSVLLDVCDWPL